MSTVVDRAYSRSHQDLRVPRSFGGLLLLLAAALLVNSLIGPMGANLVDYPIADTVRNQLIGLEIVTVVLVVPWCVYAAVAAFRNQPGSALLAFTPAAYTLLWGADRERIWSWASR